MNGSFVVFYKADKDHNNVEHVNCFEAEKDVLSLVSPCVTIERVFYVHKSGRVDQYQLSFINGKVRMQIIPEHRPAIDN